VHARNLFHVSVAMWDAWVAYDQTQRRRYLTTERAQPPSDPEGAERQRSPRAILVHWRDGLAPQRGCTEAGVVALGRALQPMHCRMLTARVEDTVAETERWAMNGAA